MYNLIFFSDHPKKIPKVTMVSTPTKIIKKKEEAILATSPSNSFFSSALHFSYLSLYPHKLNIFFPHRDQNFLSHIYMAFKLQHKSLIYSRYSILSLSLSLSKELAIFLLKKAVELVVGTWNAIAEHED